MCHLSRVSSIDVGRAGVHTISLISEVVAQVKIARDLDWSIMAFEP